MSLILRNDFRAYKFVFNNKQRLLRMSKLDKLYAIRRNSNIPFSGISFKNVDATELNQVISML